ncbi:cysteine--tRNA ligase [Candidatus Viridilinea mediisalina]|uniref:Cysteine--tRNA ligase n=1 Tax=Candidatus Viridilinea mediisalina TaxID=2024553 RepID=A0A2A6RIE3_9CHLR|nr:cysteine--tRNA ligase [Candidatus Viridilinea mediisalina]PDW02847.1 cysteine--tRNA ligase [Candidatus Viridilinea mediisalina]
MTIHIYNTLSRKLEPLTTIEPGVVRMYVCGVTPYDEAHIGHAMSAIVFDVIRRYLEYRGYQVQHIVNFTDVDDKVIERANAVGADPLALSTQLADEFLGQLAALNVLPASAYPRVTQTIPEIRAFVEGLVERGYAYAADGDVYFRVGQDEDYGKLSGRSLDEMLTGTRFEVDPRKESPADFALWKAARPSEPAWESPWGPGRPGWHIECSAMCVKHLGSQIDIHGGGNDLIFPHHENEIAQSESLTGQPFARFWVHNGMLQLVNPATRQVEKMSKSLGNMMTIAKFLEQYEGDVFRLIVLSSSYRSPLTYNSDVAADNQRKLERLRSALAPASGTLTSGPVAEQLAQAVTSTHDSFTAAMDNDFNSAGALAALFDLVRAINSARAAALGGAPFSEAQASLRALAGVLGLRLEPAQPQQHHTLEPFIELLINTRNELRKLKQFALADQIRNRLAELGVTLEDGPHGTRWKL